MRVALAVLMIAALAACSGGGKASTSTSTPQGALLHQLDLLNKGQFGPAYDEILTAQKSLFTRDQYVACMGTKHVPTFSASVESTYTETASLPGVGSDAPSTAITVKVTAGGQDGGETTFHEFNENGQWKFTVTDPADFAKGAGCTDG